jgi:uncharacterized protein
VNSPIRFGDVGRWRSPFCDTRHGLVRLDRFEEKRRANIRKHGFDFADAIEMFSGAMLVYPDTRHDYEEARWSGLGWIGGSLTQIVFIEKEPDIIRIISLRKATIREPKEFEKTIDDGLEAH